MTRPSLGTAMCEMLRRALVRRADLRVAFCEAPAAIGWHQSAPRSQYSDFSGNGGEDCPPTSTPAIGWPPKLRLATGTSMQITTPLHFRDIESVSELAAKDSAFHAKTYKEVTLATTPVPDWPFVAGIRQANSNHPVEDRAVIARLSFAGSLRNGKRGGRSGFSEEADGKKSSSGNHDNDNDNKNKNWMLAAVIDGHSGWQTSEWICKNLAAAVDAALQALEVVDVASVTGALGAAFEGLDRLLLAQLEPAFDLGHTDVTKPGATTVCALLNKDTIVVANIGDSRAYLRKTDGSVVPLSSCHNAGDPAEARKLRETHPDENDIIKTHTAPATDPEEREIRDPPNNTLQRALTYLGIKDFSTPRPRPPACYTKGRLQLTRAFGDFYLKYPKFANDWERLRLRVKEPHSFPYLSARPEVTVIQRDPVHDDFLILASDGVWDELTPTEATNIASSILTCGGPQPCSCDHPHTVAQAAAAVQRMVLERVAWKNRVTAQNIIDRSPKARRSVIDDITCVVIDLKSDPANFDAD